jgi:hypothetical protein
VVLAARGRTVAAARMSTNGEAMARDDTGICRLVSLSYVLEPLRLRLRARLRPSPVFRK